MSAATDHAAGADRLLIGQALTVVRDGRRILDEVGVRVEGGQVLAVTGPSGSGKSTVARVLARRLGWRYVDTGATYRAATLAVLREGTELTDAAAVAAVVDRARIAVSTDPDVPGTTLDGDDVSAVIRGAEVTAAVSAVSVIGRHSGAHSMASRNSPR